jgi:NADH-quinone oxidoreductase subunit C
VKDKVVNELRRLFPQVNEVDYRKRGYHLEVTLNTGEVRGFAEFMCDNRFYLVFVTAVHLAPAIEVVYQFASHSAPCRIIGRVQVADDGCVPTISDIYAGANWHERETKEMFGVLFSGHPCLVPLLLPEDAGELKPLLKGEGKVKTAEQVRWQVEAEK